MGQALPKIEVQKLRVWFRRWYGCISVKELASNTVLVKKIKEIETLLQELICDNQ